MGEPLLELQGIKKSFGNTEVLRGIDLSIEKGEFITFLGSSGCGKTTTLRIIAGLESPDQGHVLLNGQDVTNSAPNKRDVNTIFQNYALFPHMNVESNVGYGLRIKKLPKAKIKERVHSVLELVQLEGFGQRMPRELSGGQKQRVAIARALVNNPKLLLLDEPLGALDLKLRRQMQLELKKLQKKLGITFLYITHDQEEAINMSDRIVVMNNGVLEQTGTPDEVYNYPKTSYVAQFVGNANIIEGTVTGLTDGSAVIAAADGYVLGNNHKQLLKPGDPVTLAVRSENIKINENSDLSLPAVVTEKSFAGGMLRMVLRLNDGRELIASRHGINYDVESGESVSLSWDANWAIPVDRKDDSL